MKKFEIKIDAQNDLRIVRVVENVTYEDLIGLATETFGTDIKKNLIWEFAPGTLQLIDLEKIKGNLDIRREEHSRRAGGHTIMIAQDLSEEMLLKWYKSFAESQQFHAVTFHICSNMEEAMDIIYANKAQD